MKKDFRIVLEDKLLPVQVFFNAIPDRSFMSTLEAFSEGHGAGFNDAFCGFPGEEEFDEEPLNGIEFAIKGEEVVISYEKFISILKRVCDSFIENNPELKENVLNLIEKTENRVSILSGI